MWVGPVPQPLCGRAKGVQHLDHFGFNLRRWGKQHVGVQIALQGLAATRNGAGFGQVHCPVQAQHVAVELFHFVQPQAAALGEHNAGNAWRRCQSLCSCASTRRV